MQDRGYPEPKSGIRMQMPRSRDCNPEEEIVQRKLTVRGFWTAAIVLLVAAVAIAAAPGYHVIHTYKLGGEGGWD